MEEEKQTGIDKWPLQGRCCLNNEIPTGGAVLWRLRGGCRSEVRNLWTATPLGANDPFTGFGLRPLRNTDNVHSNS